MRAAWPGLVLLLAAQALQAGQTCEEKPATAESMGKALRLAGRVQEQLDAMDAPAAIIARVGSDVSARGLRYTHAALVWRESPQAPWTLLHKLNHCGSDRASLYQQGLGNFFLDDPYEYRALVVRPDAALARQLRDQARRDGGRAVDEPHYSLLAYPFGLGYQNSNQWLLEFVAVAQSGGTLLGRRAALRQLRDEGYEPDRIEVGPLQRLGAGVFRANVAFLDHPLAERLSGRYSVVTVESLVRHLQRQGRVAAVAELDLATEPPGSVPAQGLLSLKGRREAP